MCSLYLELLAHSGGNAFSRIALLNSNLLMTKVPSMACYFRIHALHNEGHRNAAVIVM